MNQETVESASEQIDGLAKKYQDQLGLSYSDALKKVAREKPTLWRQYSSCESHVGRKVREASEERERRVVVYQSHFNVDERRARQMVQDHDPGMRNIPLDAGSVLDVRAQERVKQGAKNYSEAVKAVLADDPLLAECYRSGRPYLEGSAAHAYEDEQTNGPTEKARLGVLINGARKSDNSPDVELMLKTANLAPDLVRGAASERINELANEFIDKLVAPGLKSERYPEALGQVRRDNPALVAAAESGRMSEEALRQIFWPWFSRD